jgi:4-amino-4-deoxy-L-arabinose transferase-like glycosyltransferase
MAVVLVQIALAAATVVVAVQLAGRLGVFPAGAALAGLFVALEPASVFHSVLLLSETLFTLALTGSLALIARHLYTGGGWSLAAGGLLLGVATLTRPIALFLPLVLFPIILAGAAPSGRWGRVQRGLAFLLLAALLPTAWAVRNYHVGGGFTVSDIGGRVLYSHVAPTVLADERGITQAEAVQELRKTRPPRVPGQRAGPLDPGARAATLATLLRSPWRTSVTLAGGASRMLIDPGYTPVCTLLDLTTLAWECLPGRNTRLERGILARAWARTRDMSGLQQGTLILGVGVLAVTYLASAAGAAGLVAARRWRTLAFLVVPIAYFIVFSAIPADSRFRVPIVPLLAILAGFGWDWVRAETGGVLRVTAPGPASSATT